eukprot:10037748-Lingulodinium_polyedra.AAC.1
MTRRTKTANAHPGRIPELGIHSAPNAPSTRKRRPRRTPKRTAPPANPAPRRGGAQGQSTQE